MIYTFEEQVIMMIYFIILGMFISMMFDTINIFFSKIKITNYILQFISWIFVTIICINYINKISNGYFPIYIILFFIIGYVIYSKLLNKHYLKILLKIKANKQFILLALFPITLYNYIIKLIKKIVVEKGKINEKNNINNNDVTNSNDSSRL